MKLQIASFAACAVLVSPLMAQTEDEADGAVDLDAIDALLGDQGVTGDEDVEDEDVDGDAPDSAADSDDETGEEDAEDGASEDDESATEEEDTPEPSDLTIAFNAYSLCSSEAGAALEEQGFAIDQIGEEALLRCSGQRAAYVNAFYFSLLPRYPDAAEPEVRGRAERLVAQSDSALINVVTAEVRELRNAPPEEEPEEEIADPEDEAAAADAENADAPPLNLQWFDGEEEAAAHMEAHIVCLSGAADERRGDSRPVEDVAEEIVAQCADEGAALTSALTDIFQRNPDYLPEGADPEWAAESAIASAGRNVERLVAAQRNQD